MNKERHPKRSEGSRSFGRLRLPQDDAIFTMTDLAALGLPAGQEGAVPAYHPILKALLAKRGLTDPEAIQTFLNPAIENLRDPGLICDLPRAAERIRRAKTNHEKIFIHGDYDVDGITGTAILMLLMEKLGISAAAFLPHREEDGYGVSKRGIRQAAEQGFKILVTVDCGTSAHQEVEFAKSLGLEVMILDHHEIPSQGLPKADFILNPHRPDCGFGFQGLSAGGLAFKLAHFLMGEQALDFLDLAAISTVCDVAPLKEDNRIIVSAGLERLGKSPRLGIRALLENAKVQVSEMNVGHLGFVIGPRINAAGRMSSPDIALRLFLSTHPKEAASLARVLEEENKLRQQEEKEVLESAVAQVERTMNFSRERVIVAAQEGWHQGVIGIVAARLVEKYERPAVVIALDQGKGKGSARSVKGFHLKEAFESASETLEGFGGHALAAGLQIKSANVENFRKKMNAYAAGLDPQSLQPVVEPDFEIELGVITGPFLQDLKLLEPHGMGNPRPIFLTKNLRVDQPPKWLGTKTLKFGVTDKHQRFEAIWFSRAGNLDTSFLKEGAKIHIIFTLKSKIWNGIETVSLEIRTILPAS